MCPASPVCYRQVFLPVAEDHFFWLLACRESQQIPGGFADFLLVPREVDNWLACLGISVPPKEDPLPYVLQDCAALTPLEGMWRDGRFGHPCEGEQSQDIRALQAHAPKN